MTSLFSGQWIQNSYHIQDRTLWRFPHRKYTAAQTWQIQVSNVSTYAKAATEEAHFYAIDD